MSIDESKWVTAAQQESYGQFQFGVRIQVFIGHRELKHRDENGDRFTDEYWAIHKKAEEIEQILLEFSLKADAGAQERAAKDKAELIGLFPEGAVYEELPNGYCSQACCKHLPWFRVMTRIGPVTIGWRKRVINIDWTESLLKWSGEEMFPDQDTTKSGGYGESRYVHAWGPEKGKEYVTKLITMTEMAPPRDH
jgi:hypothetical protein